jgi:hypothetical protein
VRVFVCVCTSVCQQMKAALAQPGTTSRRKPRVQVTGHKFTPYCHAPACVSHICTCQPQMIGIHHQCLRAFQEAHLRLSPKLLEHPHLLAVQFCHVLHTVENVRMRAQKIHRIIGKANQNTQTKAADRLTYPFRKTGGGSGP